MIPNSLDTDTIAKLLKNVHAVRYGATIVSANLEHFQGTGALVENWGEPLVNSGDRRASLCASRRRASADLLFKLCGFPESIARRDDCG
jgi:hypothetical protein